MRIISSKLLLASIGVASCLLAAGSGTSASGALGAQEPGAGFAWADACKDCHGAIYEAWSKTKHARALDRLSDANRRKECVRCHITDGGDKLIEKRLRVVNAGVQCETCHGAAAAHVADPAVRTGLVKTTPESRCRECHNEKSPHFRGFVYSAMTRLVHR